MPRRSSRAPRPPVGSPYDAAVRLLARRAHSRVELRRKLTRRGFNAEEVETALGLLSEQGYVDDASFAAGHVRRRSANVGPLALSAELGARGVDRAVSSAAVDGFDRPAQVVAATRLAERLAGNSRPAGYRELLNSVGAKLLRRGFPLGVAQEACRAVWTGTASTPEP